MNLTANEFKLLRALGEHPSEQGLLANQRELAQKSGLSLGTVNKLVASLKLRGLIQQTPSGFDLSLKGKEALKPYKVENAIILAAGLSSRFAPISYELPKGLLKVKGEILIERQIRQLKACGIEDIVVIVGYKQEYFFYLEDAFGVRIVPNHEYAQKNNHSSLWVVKESLKNSYICSSDDYFVQNPFHVYEYQANYSCVWQEGPTNEWCVEAGSGGRICGIQVGGSDSWIMLGHAYFDQAFSEAFVHILKQEYGMPQTTDKLWEDIYKDHLKELDMVIRPFEPGVIYEFDSLDELRAFDPDFIENVDSAVFDNICKVLGCAKQDICDIYPLKQGLTNLSCHFRVKDKEYVYRHPGVGTEALVDRAAEKEALECASALGIDTTFIHEDAQAGFKISRFIPDCTTLDPKDMSQVSQAMQLIRSLHESSATVSRSFDFYEEACAYEAQLTGSFTAGLKGFAPLKAKIDEVKTRLGAPERLVLCHNDFFQYNILFDSEGHIDLIDWEYAGMSDYAQDFGTFCVCSEYDKQQAELALAAYFGRTPSLAELAHNFAYIALAGWCWYLWALIKEQEGEAMTSCMYGYYRYAQDFSQHTLDLFDQLQKGA